MQRQQKILSRAIMLALAGLVANTVTAQEAVEIVTVGKMRSAADDVMVERQQSAIVSDIIDTTMISRIGDSNVATALRRVPGVTLVDDKFVYVRGLGERYSTSLLNGAQVPSPDLTRNVLPLDIFPTSILRSVAVKKSYSAELPASFSGGLVDIRTLSIPDGFLFQIEAGSSYNTETSGNLLSYQGGSDDWLGKDDGTRGLSRGLQQAVDRYQGNLSAISILQQENRQGASLTLPEAQQINRELALQLNRNVDVTEKSFRPNGSFQLGIGNNWYFDNGIEFGVVAGGAYQNTWQNRDINERSFGQPEDVFSERNETTNNVNLTGNISFGLKWYDDHSIQTSSMLLRNTDNESFIRTYHTPTFLLRDGRGFQTMNTRFEQREMRVNQIRGEHKLGGLTRDITGFSALPWLDDLSFNWFYSDATAVTEIPNESSVLYQTFVDPVSAQVLSQNLQANPTAGDFRFTDLDDEVTNYGWDVSLPLYLSRVDLTVSGGYNYAMKGRQYLQKQFVLGTTNLDYAQGLTGLPSDIFSDERILQPANSYLANIFSSNGESYLAGVINTAAYGLLDATLDDTWRVQVGVRWEDYSQVGVPWDPLNYAGCQISCNPDELQQSVFKDEDFYPSLALTYMRDDFIAEQFQLRAGYSETVIRPDLREITPTSYIDPITNVRVRGNPNVTPATIRNYDLRAEWFFDSGDNFTVSLFHKDMKNPIDFFSIASVEETFGLEILNADSATITGLEIEWLKSLSFLGNWAQPLFLAGNMTFLDTELVVGGRADAPTNPVRPLAGASDQTYNIQLGYDSMDGKHSAMLVYNVFAERLYFAGRNDIPDAYEQPFHSLDLTYFYYPTEKLTLRLRARNMLDEKVRIRQEGITTLSFKPGSMFSMDLRYTF